VVGGRDERVEGHRPEDALIHEVDAHRPVAGLLEVEKDAGEPVALRRRVAQQHLPRHPEVHDEGFGGLDTRLRRYPTTVKGDPEELATTAGHRERRAGQPFHEVLGGAVVAAQRSLVEHFDATHRGAGDGGLEAGAHDLDLGELRHP